MPAFMLSVEKPVSLFLRYRFLFAYVKFQNCRYKDCLSVQVPFLQ